jgi:hypothetical protein
MIQRFPAPGKPKPLHSRAIRLDQKPLLQRILEGITLGLDIMV